MDNYQQLTPIYALQSPSGSRPPAQANTVIMGGNNHVTRTLTFAEAHMQHAAGHPAAPMHPYQQLQSTQQPGGAYPYAPTPASQMPMPQYTYIQVPVGVVPGLGSAMMPGVADQYAQQAMLAQMQAQQGQPGMHTVMVQSPNGAYGPAYPSPLAPSAYAHQLPSVSTQVAAAGMQQIMYAIPQHAQGHEQHNRSPATPTSAARPPFQGPSPWHPASPRRPAPLAGLPPPGTPGTPPKQDHD